MRRVNEDQAIEENVQFSAFRSNRKKKNASVETTEF